MNFFRLLFCLALGMGMLACKGSSSQGSDRLDAGPPSHPFNPSVLPQATPSSVYVPPKFGSFIPANPPSLTVFQPGGTAGPGVYTSFAALFTALGQNQSPLGIFCDARFSGTTSSGRPSCQVPAGNWNFASQSVELDGTSQTIWAFQTGAFLPAFRSVFNVSVTNDGTTIPINIAGGTGVIDITARGNSEFLATLSAPLIQYTATGPADALNLQMFDNTRIFGAFEFGGTANEIVNLTGSGTFILQIFGLNNFFDANTIGCTTAAQIFIEAGLGFTPTATQPGILDTGLLPAIGFIFGTDVFINYVDTNVTPAMFAETTTQNAIDALKTRHTVRACATANVNVTSAPATIDGVALAANDLVLLPSETAASQNGIWQFAASTSPLTRPIEWATNAVIPSGTVVNCGGEGALYSNTEWKQTSASNTVDSSSPSFFPRSVTQSVSLGGGAPTGTVTITNIPILSATKSQFLISRTIATTTSLTATYQPFSILAGGLGSASVAIDATLASGAKNAADGSTLNVTIQNF